MRHAEAANPPSIRDFDRPLTERGEAMPPLAAKHMVAQGFIPQKIICSPAHRTRMTARLFMAALPQTPEIVYEENLYGAQPETVMRLIHANDDAERVMIIGHNPWAHMLAITLPSPDELMKHPEMKSMYPPASSTLIGFDGSWREANRGTGKLLDFYFPAGIL